MSRRIKVVHVITDAGPHPYFDTLARHADRDRFELIVGGVGSEGPLQESMRAAGLATFALGADRRVDYARATGRLARMLRRADVDVVQAHLVDGSLVGLGAARLAETPLAILTAHHSHEVPLHGAKLRAVERALAGPLSDRIIAPSGGVASVMADEVGIPRDKIEVVHHGFEVDSALDPTAVDGARVRAELGLEDKTVLSVIGRHFWVKNHVALVQAFTALSDPDLRLVFVGGGDASDVQAVADDRVLVTGPRDDVPELLAAFDAFVHPAIAESFAMVIVEAMSMALPVLCTPTGIAPDVIEDGVNGLLARSSSVEDLRAGLSRLLDLRSRWPAMGAAAREAVVGFRADRMVARYEACYLEWLRA
jgi:glycosyltransferase involved in cell wall biosynthesis